MERPRTRSRNNLRRIGPGRRALGTSNGLSLNTGALASAAWLASRALVPSDPKWFVAVAFDLDERATLTDLDELEATRFQLDIFAEEWGFRFCHQGRASWIRVTDIAFVHGRDDHGLFRKTRRLKHIGDTLREVERRYCISFPRERALIATNVRDPDSAIRAWAASL